MRVLLSGGCGVIGSCIATRLMDAGHDVEIIDDCGEPRNEWIRAQLLRRPIPPLVQRRRVEHMHADLNTSVRHADAVIHCAASTGIPYSMDAPDDDWERNVEGTRALLNALRVHPRPTVMFSSIKPYWVPPRSNMGAGLDEGALLSADEPYAASKAAGSMLAQAYARSYDLPVVTMRFSNLFGPAPCHGPRHGWVTWFCISAAIDRPLVVQGTGNQARDMLYESDIYAAVMVALEKADELKGEVFNVGGGRENIISVNEAAMLLHDLTGVDIHQGEARKLDDDLVFVSFEKFKRATGWSPQVEVREGIKKVLLWAQENKAALQGLYANV